MPHELKSKAMRLKKFLEQLVEEETTKKPLSHRIIETLIMLVIAFIVFSFVNPGIRRIDKDYDKRWIKWDVRMENVFNRIK